MPSPTPSPVPETTPAPNTGIIPISASLKAGDHIAFGYYPQTEDAIGGTPIEWRVLDVRDGKALVISERGLDAMPYNRSISEVTWETCTLRAWLNEDFLNAAFSAAEQERILTTAVDNSQSQHNSENRKTYRNYADTQDRIFLLSDAEANQYFGVTGEGSNADARTEPTAYAVKQGAYSSQDYRTGDGKAAGWWWLRSPGDSSNSASGVSAGGSLSSSVVLLSRNVVRPAMWIDLNAAAQ